MAMYHSAELAFLSAVYGNLLTFKEPMDFFFRPQPGAFGGVLRIAPDLLPPKSTKILQVWENGHEHRDFDPVGLTVRLPRTTERQVVRVRIASSSVTFSADTLDTTGGHAKISLFGSLGATDLAELREDVEAALTAGCTTISLDATDLVYVDPQAVRYQASDKQHREVTFDFVGAKGQVAQQLQESEAYQELVAASGSKGGQS
jgi:hypothetical protein